MCKKLMVLLCLVTSVFFFSAKTPAATAGVDLMLNGTFSSNKQDTQDIASISILNIEQAFPEAKFKLDLDVLGGKKSNILGDDTYSGYDLKAGFRAVDSDEVKLDFTLALYNGTITQTDLYDSGYYDREFAINSGLIGIDLILNLSDKAFMEGSVAVSLLASANTTDKYEDGFILTEEVPGNVSLYNYKVKFNYVVADNVAVSVGYRYYKTSIDLTSTLLSGYTAGLTFNF